MESRSSEQTRVDDWVILTDQRPELAVIDRGYRGNGEEKILPAALLYPRGMRWILPTGAALGLGIEIIQPLVGREASAFDFLADALGLALRRFRTRSAA